MDPNDRKPTASLAQQLFHESYRFEFHQALKILERMYPDVIPLGKSSLPSQEIIHLKSRILFSYPPSDIYNITAENSFSSSASEIIVSKIKMQVNFLGIAGANGPLPLPYTEKIFERFKMGDETSADFLDIFNHRLLSILHRIRRKYWIGLDSQNPEKTRMAQVVYAILGLGTPYLQKRFTFPDRNLLFYAGLFWQHPRSSEGLRTLLQHYFKYPVDIIPLKGGWEKIAPDQQTRIGFQETFNKLGQGAVLGTKVWNAMQKITVQMGPLTRTQFHSFLPHAKQSDKLFELIQFYLGHAQKFDVRFIVKASAVEKTHLGQHTYLGWSSWLKHHTLSQDDHQVVLSPDSAYVSFFQEDQADKDL